MLAELLTFSHIFQLPEQELAERHPERCADLTQLRAHGEAQQISPTLGCARDLSAWEALRERQAQLEIAGCHQRLSLIHI